MFPLTRPVRQGLATTALFLFTICQLRVSRFMPGVSIGLVIFATWRSSWAASLASRSRSRRCAIPSRGAGVPGDCAAQE